MAHSSFKPAKGGTGCYFKCPNCKVEIRVHKFSLEPVLQGDGAFVTKWFLKMYARCRKCKWSGSRAAGTMEAKSR